MFTDIRNFVITHFQRADNGLMQLILVHAFVFIGLLLLKTGLVLAGYPAYYQTILQYLTLPAAWETFLQQPWSLVTYFWVHEHFFDIIWHLLFLYTFGKIILQGLSSRSLIALYTLGGIGGGICFLLLYNLAPGFRGINTSLVGSAASLYAVMTGAATLFPYFYFRLLFVGNIKIQYIVGGLLLLSCFEVSQYQAVGIANLSGGLVGYLYVYSLKSFLQGNSVWFNLTKLFRKKAKIQVTSKKENVIDFKQGKMHENQEPINQILDKVAESGYESLSQEEKQQLFDAGQ